MSAVLARSVDIPLSDYHPRLLKLISDLTMNKHAVDDRSIVELGVQILQRLLTGECRRSKRHSWRMQRSNITWHGMGWHRMGWDGMGWDWGAWDGSNQGFMKM